MHLTCICHKHEEYRCTLNLLWCNIADQLLGLLRQLFIEIPLAKIREGEKKGIIRATYKKKKTYESYHYSRCFSPVCKDLITPHSILNLILVVVTFLLFRLHVWCILFLLYLRGCSRLALLFSGFCFLSSL